MDDARETLRRLLAAAKAQEYLGYDKHDGLLSPALAAVLGWSRPSRLVATQLVARSPWNLRPYLGIPKTRNPKGIGLFAYANLGAHKIFGEPAYLDETRALLAWLVKHGSGGFAGKCWGYQYPWQDVGFLAPAGFPNRVVTCWIGFAFFRAWQETGERAYLDVCKRVCEFLLSAPNRLVDTPEELCLSYVPDPAVTWAVMDVSALSGKMLALTGSADGDKGLLSDALRCMTYVVRRQTPYGAWYYTDPPGDSHIMHDNYHTGIILDCLQDYERATGDRRFSAAWSHGLHYYQQALFTETGAPKWMNNKEFPYDIHGAAQGIITFSKAAEKDRLWLAQAEKVLTWTMRTLYDRESGLFWYQRTRRRTKRFSLMRWCNGWMAVAVGEWLGKCGVRNAE